MTFTTTLKKKWGPTKSEFVLLQIQMVPKMEGKVVKYSENLLDPSRGEQ